MFSIRARGVYVGMKGCLMIAKARSSNNSGQVWGGFEVL